jgi:3-oxoacyl-[acyl-carrier protein] reductase
MKALNKKHKALITGASRGIGASIASILDQQDIEILTPSRSILNLSDPNSIKSYITQKEKSGIDIVINNAGINYLNDIDNINDHQWQEMIQINLTAPMQLIRGFSWQMKKQQWGRIVNISSIFGLVTKESRSVYSATKAGLNGFTRTTAVELAPYGITVNAVCPGYVETDLTLANNSPEQISEIASKIPMKRLAKTDEIAKLVAFLCSEDNTYLTGQTIAIDGGFTCQ